MVSDRGGPSRLQRRLSDLLVLGCTRSRIAESLYVSVRTVDREIDVMRRTFGARQRVAMGIHLVWNEFVDVNHFLLMAQQCSPEDGWAHPGVGGLEMLGELAGNNTVSETARRLGLTETTIRRRMAELARRNGVAGQAGLGALAASLSWIAH